MRDGGVHHLIKGAAAATAQRPTMVLADLGRRLNQAFADLQRQPTVDEATIDQLLKAVCNALLASDVSVKLVQSLRQNVKNEVGDLLNDKSKAA